MNGEDELEELDEDSLHDSEALPAERPNPIVIETSNLRSLGFVFALVRT
ncbi:hypothetical protein [Lentzea indica]|nr:hypothetical protein [Lentzea indica]